MTIDKTAFKTLWLFFHNKSAGSERNLLKVCRYVRYFLLCRVRLPFFVKTGEKHPRFYTKIFRFLNIKKARKYGLFQVNIHLVSPIWSWKRDLNTRPAHYEWAALPTELFQHILNFSVSLFDPPPCRFINNPRPAHYEWAALPTEPYQHIRPKYYTPKPHICQHQFKIFLKVNSRFFSKLCKIPIK